MSNVTYSLPILKKIMKDNKIKGVTLMNKPEILMLLNKRGLIPDEALVKSTKPDKEIIRTIRHTPKKVVITDSETGIETEYPSLYRAGRTFGCAAKVIANNNGKIWRKRYAINVINN